MLWSEAVLSAERNIVFCLAHLSLFHILLDGVERLVF
jgi:hypothetical protein